MRILYQISPCVRKGTTSGFSKVLWSRAERPRRVRPPPLQAGRADFPHPASRVKQPACASPSRQGRSPSPLWFRFALTLTASPVEARGCSDICSPKYRRHPLRTFRPFFLRTFPFLAFPFARRDPSLHRHCPTSPLLWSHPTSAFGFPTRRPPKFLSQNFRCTPPAYTPPCSRGKCRLLCSRCWLHDIAHTDHMDCLR